jgi:large subunit ribosomal protein L15
MKKIFNKIASKKKTEAPVQKEVKSLPKKASVKTPRKVKKIEAGVTPVLGLHNLPVPFGAHKKRKYLGRGSGSGHGKTSTRGSKGQTSRAGRHFYLGFEGGQSPLIRRMPKRGFAKQDKRGYQIVNLKDLSRIKEATITLSVLEEKGLIQDKNKLVKILGDGAIKNPVTVQAHAFSKRAAQEIATAGGKPEIVNV